MTMTITTIGLRVYDYMTMIDHVMLCFFSIDPDQNHSILYHIAHTCFSQEEEDVALNGQPETVEEDAPAGAEESDAASSDEKFGFTASAAKAKPAKPAPKRARREESAAIPVQTKQNKAGPSDEQLAARLEKATAGIELLKKITALSLWQGSVKEKDVSSKLGKLCELQTQLEKDPGEVAQRLAQELQGLINQTNTCLLAIENAHDMVEKAGLSNPQFAFDNDEFKIYEDFFDAMQIDCRTAILTEIGRKLTEAGIWSQFVINH